MDTNSIILAYEKAKELRDAKTGAPLPSELISIVAQQSGSLPLAFNKVTSIEELMLLSNELKLLMLGYVIMGLFIGYNLHQLDPFFFEKPSSVKETIQ